MKTLKQQSDRLKEIAIELRDIAATTFDNKEKLNEASYLCGLAAIDLQKTVDDTFNSILKEIKKPGKIGVNNT